MHAWAIIGLKQTSVPCTSKSDLRDIIWSPPAHSLDMLSKRFRLDSERIRLSLLGETRRLHYGASEYTVYPSMIIMLYTRIVSTAPVFSRPRPRPLHRIWTKLIHNGTTLFGTQHTRELHTSTGEHPTKSTACRMPVLPCANMQEEACCQETGESAYPECQSQS